MKVEQDQRPMNPTMLTPAAKPVCPAPVRAGSYRVAVMGLVAVGLVGLAAAAGLLTGSLLSPAKSGGLAADPAPEGSFEGWDKPAAVKNFFKGWDKPEAVLVLTGQMHGYLLPCGCSRPQKGGLERRYNFLQLLKAEGWPVAAVDIGDVPQDKAPHHLPNVQGQIKYETAMKALKLMGYTAVGTGESERRMPLSRILDGWALDEKQPRVLAANLLNKDDFPDEVGDWSMTTPPGSDLKIGVAGFVGPSAAKAVADGDKVKWSADPEFKSLKAILDNQVYRDAKVRVLLLQGTEEEARTIATLYPNTFQVILRPDEQEEPPRKPAIQGGTMIVTVGHKGKWVGVVGIFPGSTKGSYKLQYEIAEMTEDLETPKGQEKSNPILGVMEDYTHKLKEGNYLKQYPQIQHPLVAALPTTEYMGSESCRGCHAAAFAKWTEPRKSKVPGHANAYQTLVDAKRPALRDYDPECIVCHVTGFGYKSGFQNLRATPLLKDVGCESCHGPCQDHVIASKNATIYPLINPWKAPPGELPAAKKARELKINHFCMDCHDSDNDVHWDFDKRWAEIEHHTPPKAAPAPKAPNK